jgi:hypothetical protein
VLGEYSKQCFNASWSTQLQEASMQAEASKHKEDSSSKLWSDY